MVDVKEDQIREKAYALWEADGKPDGRHEAHWEQAHRELSKGEGIAVLGESDAEGAPAETDGASTEEKTPLSVIDGGADPSVKRKRKAV